MAANRRKCKSCREWFIPSMPIQPTCLNRECMTQYAVNHANQLGKRRQQDKARELKAKAKAERARTKQAKEDLKSISTLTKEAQVEFNKFIRLRDRDDPCISCGRFDAELPDLHGGKWDAGHFFTRGAYPELRFEELNCHKQCKSCNGGSGKYAKKGKTVAAEYRERLIEKIGMDKVGWLEGPHELKRYRRDELIEIKAKYRAKWRELEKEINQ